MTGKKVTNELIELDLRAEQERRRRFLAGWSSPLRILDMSGWLFLLPADITYLEAQFRRTAPGEESGLLEMYEADWQAVFTAHHSLVYDYMLAVEEIISSY